MTTMDENTSSDRVKARLAGIRAAVSDFAAAGADGMWQRTAGLHLPADGALRNAWLAAYAEQFAELTAPCMTETRLVAAGRVPLFHAGQRIEFTSFDDFALNGGVWQAGEVDGYYEPDWQPKIGDRALRLDVRVIGRRGQPIGKRIEVQEFQVRVPQEVSA